MFNEEVRKIMTKSPVTVNASDDIPHVTKVMQENKVQQMPVVEDGILVGMVTSFDLWRESTAGRLNTKVGDIMTKNVIKIAPKDKVLK